MVSMARGDPAETETSEDRSRVTWTYYDDPKISQEVAMRSGASEARTAYSAGNDSQRQASTPGSAQSSQQMHEQGGIKSAGEKEYVAPEDDARVLVIFDDGKVMAGHRIEN